MTRARRVTVGAVVLAGMLVLAGCGPNPKDLEIQALNERIAGLQQENDGLRAQLASAIRDRDAALARARSLERENADLRAQLARGERERPDEWVGAGAWDWIDLGTDFLFDSGKATLKPAAHEKLQKVVNDINSAYADRMVLVIGHTDAEPIKVTAKLWADNLDLSCNRGMTVFRELMKMGISPERMISCGQGEYRPKVPNDPKTGRAQQNRRVQIAVIPMPGQIESGPAPAPAAATEALIPK